MGSWLWLGERISRTGATNTGAIEFVGAVGPVGRRGGGEGTGEGREKPTAANGPGGSAGGPWVEGVGKWVGGVGWGQWAPGMGIMPPAICCCCCICAGNGAFLKDGPSRFGEEGGSGADTYYCFGLPEAVFKLKYKIPPPCEGGGGSRQGGLKLLDHQKRWFKKKQFKCTEISNSDNAT